MMFQTFEFDGKQSFAMKEHERTSTCDMRQHLSRQDYACQLQQSFLSRDMLHGLSAGAATCCFHE